MEYTLKYQKKEITRGCSYSQGLEEKPQNAKVGLSVNANVCANRDAQR